VVNSRRIGVAPRPRDDEHEPDPLRPRAASDTRLAVAFYSDRTASQEDVALT
jgi:hypothetical protein